RLRAAARAGGPTTAWGAADRGLVAGAVRAARAVAGRSRSSQGVRVLHSRSPPTGCAAGRGSAIVADRGRFRRRTRRGRRRRRSHGGVDRGGAVWGAGVWWHRSDADSPLGATTRCKQGDALFDVIRRGRRGAGRTR